MTALRSRSCQAKQLDAGVFQIEISSFRSGCTWPLDREMLHRYGARAASARVRRTYDRVVDEKAPRLRLVPLSSPKTRSSGLLFDIQ